MNKQLVKLPDYDFQGEYLKAIDKLLKELAKVKYAMS